MVAELAVGWGFGKVADLLWNGAKETLQDKLTKTDLERAVAAGLRAAEDWNGSQSLPQQLFYHCDPVQQSRFQGKAFADAAVQAELIKALTNQGQPDRAFLAARFEQMAAELELPLNLPTLLPWLGRFVEMFFEQTQTFIRYQIARADYLEQLANWFDDVKFAGVAVAGQEVERSEQLTQIFVMPDLQEERHRVGLDLGRADRQLELLQEQRGRAEQEQLGQKLAAAAVLKQNQSKLVLLGAPGSGKTTLLSYFAVMLARGGAAELGLEADCLPILIRIRDWARQPDLALADYARQFAEKSMAMKPLPAGFFEYWLDGRALILLDGLDEVAEESKRHHLVQCIENFLGQYGQNRAVITSRPAGYRRDFFRTDEYPHYQLLPFGDAQQEEFINRWYDSRIADPAEADRRKAGLRKALSDSDRIKLLARNPLLLTIMALIHRYQAVLPKQRFRLYEKAVETLLTAWDSNKELTNHEVLKYLDLDDLQRLMERLAYWIHTQGSTGDAEGGTLIDRDLLLETLCAEIQEQKQVKRYQAKEEAERFVGFIRDRTGLLNEQGQDCYAFVHKTFQEYLTAQEISYQAENEGEFEIVLKHIHDHLHDPHWQEVLLLLIAQQKPNNAAKAISAVLDRNSPYEKWLHRDLLFAGRCLAENPKGLKTAKGNRTDEVLEGLVGLEVASESLTGSRIKGELKKVISSLHETDFATKALEMLKQIEKIDDFRLKDYRVELGGEDNSVIQEYLYLLKDNNSLVRYRALYGLGELDNRSEVVLNRLLDLFKDEDLYVRYEAADALVKLGNRSKVVLNYLIGRLGDEDSSTRYRAAEALGKLGDRSESVLNCLLELLTDDDSSMRYRVATALSNLGNNSESVLNCLFELLTDRDLFIRYRAADILVNLDNRSESILDCMLELLTDEESFIRPYASSVLVKLGDDAEVAADSLLELLADEDSVGRAHTAEALGILGNSSESVLNGLLRLLTDKGSDVRSSAAEALIKLGESSESVRNCVLNMLTDQDSDVRFTAALVFAELGNSSVAVFDSLLDLLKDDDSNVRYSAAQALGTLGKKNNQICETLKQWLEAHQDSAYVSNGIDALWDSVNGE